MMLNTVILGMSKKTDGKINYAQRTNLIAFYNGKRAQLDWNLIYVPKLVILYAKHVIADLGGCPPGGVWN